MNRKIFKMSSCCEHPKEKSHTPSCCGGHTHKQRFDFMLWGSLTVVLALCGVHFLLPQVAESFPWLGEMASAAYELLHAMWWGVLFGMVFIGVLSKVPREFVMAILGKGGTFGGLLRATGAGVLLDLCSHGILMVATKLYERGASIGQVIAFLLASPWNSFSLTLVLIGLIGWQWTLAFIVLSMGIAWVAGWVFDRLVRMGILPENPNTEVLAADFQFWAEARKRWQATRFTKSFVWDMVQSGVKESRMVMRWLLFGIVLAAVLRVVLDPDQFQNIFGPTALGLLITMGLATVLEVCSEGSAPIAADILTRAHAPGNAFAFLMAGVATDYTEIMVLKETTKSWKIALFLPLITVPQVLLVAWLIHLFA